MKESVGRGLKTCSMRYRKARRGSVEEYKLEKWIWTEVDFEVMGWHDCQIHAMAFYPEEFEFALDIDYIFQWVEPQPGERYFKFYVSPATLVFKNVHDLEFDIDSYSGKLEIDNIRREDKAAPINAEFIGKATEWLWTVECQEGEIRFRSVGYEEFIRAAPQLTPTQSFDRKTRGVSFARGKLNSSA